MDELIVLLDKANQPIGTALKLASHHANTPLHLAFSCYLFNDQGELLLTKRADSKKVWPGVWTNSVCGHPLPEEPFNLAIARRAKFELGLVDTDNLQPLLEDYSYRTPPFNGIIENEFCPVFAARIKSSPLPNPDEVQQYRWVTWATLQKEIAKQPEVFSYWLKDQLPLLEKCDSLKEYLNIPA